MAARVESPTVRYISECFIKPKYTREESELPIYLSPCDLSMVFIHYMQKGLLFPKPPAFDTDQNHIQELLEKLQESLSLALVHFYPLSGCLATLKHEGVPSNLVIYVDCKKGPGARFIHASLDLTLDDILSPTDVPQVVRSFFDHDGSVNYDGITKSLLAIQVTELIDGIFIGCSMNHMIGDGTSFWHFLNSWSEIFKAEGKAIAISRPPTYEKLFPEGHGPIISIPFSESKDLFNSRDEEKEKAQPEMIRERIFHFSSESVAKLKAKANAECNTSMISSLQALSALIWRCITRWRNFPPHQKTNFTIVLSNRSRLVPPVSDDCFANHLHPLVVTTTCDELLGGGLGFAAWLLHQAVTNHTDKEARKWIESWVHSPFLSRGSESMISDPCSILLGGSQWFNMYGNEFGLGKPIGIRSGSANKCDGKVTVSPGSEGGRSMDLEICLQSHVMTSLESDMEFMECAAHSEGGVGGTKNWEKWLQRNFLAADMVFGWISEAWLAPCTCCFTSTVTHFCALWISDFPGFAIWVQPMQGINWDE
ncbi:hypothetical protein ACH5RR_033377 [Cinchona calisaya]|uniref:Uncharacterized protein n=1 Tax=Cinchona calisaya TaxID=153742 RepID=A0ABD2YKT1_9GENT